VGSYKAVISAEKNQRFLLTRLIAVKSNRRPGFQRPSPVIAGGE
jgi:hypothetical protein